MALDAGWDEELLRIEIESLEDMDFDVGLTGFSEDELAELYGEDNQSEVEDDDYDLSDALEKAAFVKRGDVWTVGRHKLMCGDATSREDVDALMDGKTETWDSRKDAMEFYLRAMAGSEGSEQSRYTKIYTELSMGMSECSDEE